MKETCGACGGRYDQVTTKLNVELVNDGDNEQHTIYENMDCGVYKPNVRETENSILWGITMLVPGIEKNDLIVNVLDDVLKISYSHTERKSKYPLKGFHTESFVMEFVIEKNVDKDSIRACLEDGILYVMADKFSVPQSYEKNIKIQ